MRKRDKIEPCTMEGWSRVVVSAAARQVGAKPLGAADRMPLFGGPENLVKLAVELAESHAPSAERLICHYDDYIAAGLGRNGPMTFLALKPRMPRMAFAASADPTVSSIRKAILEPDPSCPRGEIRIRA